MREIIVSVLLLLFTVACNNTDVKNVEPDSASTANTIPEATNIPYTIVNVYPHDTSAYTQGLEFMNENILKVRDAMGSPQSGK
jgi:glutamine cyclotransferase